MLRRNLLFGLSIAAAIGVVLAPESTSAADATIPLGAAKIDVTPVYPVRLTGYASRQGESEGVAQRLWAKALAIGGDGEEGPAVLMTVDNCGVPDNVTDEVAARLKSKAGIPRERVVICSTHTHTGPWLKGFLPWHFVEPLPQEHQDHILKYTLELTDKLERVALDALSSRRPGRLAWSQGKVTFAANRRVLKDGKWTGFGVNPEGPVDHSLPVLQASQADGKVIALVVNYACHGTTLTGKHNQIHGDWAGCAQELIESQTPGAIAMVSLGCGADANPEPRGEMEMTAPHGRAVADEVRRLISGKLHPVAPKLSVQMRTVRLPFDTLPTRAELEARVAAGRQPKASTSDVLQAHRARGLLDTIEREGKLPAALDYPITCWAFGNDLKMVFLPGEVVVDYALRLKRELPDMPLWITAYANDVPCYIASKRILAEGGYEADQSMISYGQPTRLAPAAEDTLIDAVRAMLAGSK